MNSSLMFAPGRRRRLIVVIRSYYPDVVCGEQIGLVPTTASCQPAALNLPADTSLTLFGHLSYQVRTPWKIAIRESKNLDSLSGSSAFQKVELPATDYHLGSGISLRDHCGHNKRFIRSIKLVRRVAGFRSREGSLFDEWPCWEVHTYW